MTTTTNTTGALPTQSAQPMTAAQARDYVLSHDDDNHDERDLEQAFAALFERPADDDDRAEGLWSHLCAAIEDAH